MASSLIHLAITDELLRQFSFSSPQRLRLGSILPDAGTGNSHLKITLCNGTKPTYDLDRFRHLFGERMQTDDLYLGYYLHLVQDLAYRQFLYGEHQWSPFVPGNIEKLHHDYALCNSAIVKRYGVHGPIDAPDDFAKEPIHALCGFDLTPFLQELETQFSSTKQGQAFFFTPELAADYIQKATRLCMQELSAQAQGTTSLPPIPFAWSSGK